MKPRWIMAFACVLLLFGATGLILWQQSENPKSDAQLGRQLARDACSDLGSVVEDVTEDESFDRILSTVRNAETASNRATARDPLWRPLAGAAAAVRHALQEDDPQAATVGLRVAAAECDRAGTPIDFEPE